MRGTTGAFASNANGFLSLMVKAMNCQTKTILDAFVASQGLLFGRLSIAAIHLFARQHGSLGLERRSALCFTALMSILTHPRFFTDADVLLTHQDCMDGAGCAIVFLAFGGNKSNIHYTPPQHDMVDMKAINLLNMCRGTLYIADVSVSEEAATILGRSNRVRLFDHHKSAIPLAKKAWCEIDVNNKRCGSKVLLQHVFSNLKGNEHQSVYSRNVARFIDAIDDRDRWVHSDPFSADLSDLFCVLQQDQFVAEFAEHQSLEFDERLQFVITTERTNRVRYTQSLLEKVKTHRIHGAQVGFVACDSRYVSDAGNLLSQVFNLDAVLLVTPSKISVRSSQNSPFDMSVIAQRFKGGGHKHASGFSVENLTGLSTLDWVISFFREYDFSNGNPGQHKPKQRAPNNAQPHVSALHTE